MRHHMNYTTPDSLASRTSPHELTTFEIASVRGGSGRWMTLFSQCDYGSTYHNIPPQVFIGDNVTVGRDIVSIGELLNEHPRRGFTIMATIGIGIGIGIILVGGIALAYWACNH